MQFTYFDKKQQKKYSQQSRQNPFKKSLQNPVHKQTKKSITFQTNSSIDKREQSQNFQFIDINQSYQTDIEQQFHYRQKKQSNPFLNKKQQNFSFTEKEKQINYEKQQQKIQNLPLIKQNTIVKKQLFSQRQKEAIKSKSQIKYIQNIKEKIIKQKYPQNVITRVYPFCQNQQYFQKNNLQKTYQSQPIPSFINERKKYQHVQWQKSEYNIISKNLKWIAFTIAFDQLRKKFNINHHKSSKQINSQQLPFKINKSYILQQQEINQHLLQLKCILRYRHVKQILVSLKEIVQSYFQHNQSFGLDDIFQFERIPILEYLEYELAIFSNLVMEMFIKLLITMVNDYKQTSKDNKEYVEKLFMNQKKNSSKSIQIMKEKQLHNKEMMLENQAIFRPYQKVLNAIKYGKPLNQSIHPIAAQRKIHSKNQSNHNKFQI